MPNLADVWHAIEEGDASTLRKLLTENRDLVNKTNEWGTTPLMYAASWMGRTVGVIDVILQAGANVNWQTSEGYTALHRAIDVDGEANLNAAEVIERLVAAGASLTLRQHYGWTPLLCAVVTGGAVEVKALLKAGANPNETLPSDTLPAFNSGRTTLMAALTNPQSEEIVRALLGAGADPKTVDGHGMNVFEYADLIRRESPPGRFSDRVGRCAELARIWARQDASQETRSK